MAEAASSTSTKDRAFGRPAGWSVSASLTVLVLVAVGLIHHETVISIARTWNNSATYTHGWLILPFSAWLIWRQRAFVAPLRPRVWWPALVAAVVLELVWVAAAIASVVGPQQAVVVALIPVTVLLLLGPGVTRALAFPLGYLVFAIPWGDGLVPMLQDVTAYMAVGLLKVTGVPVFWEGRLISIPAGNFEVAEACAGVRYLIAALALGTLFAYLFFQSLWRRVLFVAASIVVPIVANGIRAWGIIMIASLSDMRLAVGVDHLLYGWLFFGIVMFLLFWLGTFWREPERQPPAPATRARAAGVGSHVPLPPLPSVAAAVVIIALSLVASLGPEWLARTQPTPSTRVELPAGADGRRGSTADAADWYTGFTGADDVRLRLYPVPEWDEPVALLVIHYRRETQGAELIGSRNHLRGDTWDWIGGGAYRLQVGDREREFRELRLRRGDRRRLLWSWYDIGGWQTTSPVLAKVYAAVKRVTGQRGDATLVALGSDYGLEPEEARKRVTAFLEHHPGLLASRALIEEH